MVDSSFNIHFYTVDLADNVLTITDTKTDESTVFNTFIYQINDSSTFSQTIDSKGSNKTFDIKLTITSKSYTNISATTETTFQRL